MIQTFSKKAETITLQGVDLHFYGPVEVESEQSFSGGRIIFRTDLGNCRSSKAGYSNLRNYPPLLKHS